ncbi:MAG: sensor histidine kinase [Dehalococcoidia bacterium]
MIAPRRTSWWIAAALAALSSALAATGFVLAFQNRGLPIAAEVADAPKWFGTQQALATLVFLVPGWYLAARVPSTIFGWLLLAGAIGHGCSSAGWGYVIASEVGGQHYLWPSVAAFLIGPGTAIEVPIIATIMALYPDGKRPPGLLGAAALVFVGFGVTGTFTSLFDPLNEFAADPNSSLAHLHNPIGTTFFQSFEQGGVIWMAPSGVGASLVIIVRWLRAKGEMRRVLSWIALANISGAVFGPLVFLGPEWFLISVQAPTILILGALVAATLRHRVYGVEIVVSRVFVYFALAATVAAVYAAMIGAAVLLFGEANLGASLAAAIVAALALAPARSRIEQIINRLLFGDRNDPYRVLSQVGTKLESRGEPEELLPAFADQVVSALRVPFVVVEYKAGRTKRRVAASNSGDSFSESDSEVFTLTHGGADIGRLIVGHRSGERSFSTGERELLANLARQASAAVANLVLTEDLKISRERIVSAREEERRRLRRDLHDGLGPILTGAAMMIDAGRNLIATDPEMANEQFLEARAQVKGAIEDVRRLVYALRPPALDELGLVGALKEQVQRGPVAVTINAEGSLAELPAAVEVAAFRIISEAVTNAARHSSATTCTIDINLNGALEIDIRDDGRNGAPWRPGVGISSMRERAAELGGSCETGPDPEGHGRVHAVLPVSVAT